MDLGDGGDYFPAVLSLHRVVRAVRDRPVEVEIRRLLHLLAAKGYAERSGSGSGVKDTSLTFEVKRFCELWLYRILGSLQPLAPFK
jgi:hypothetical protein